MSGVTINACLLLALTRRKKRKKERKGEQRELWDWVSLSGRPRLGAAAAAAGTPFRSATAPAGGVRVEAGRASCTHTHVHTGAVTRVFLFLNWISVFAHFGVCNVHISRGGITLSTFDWDLGWRALRCFSTEKPCFAGSGFRPFLFYFFVSVVVVLVGAGTLPGLVLNHQWFREAAAVAAVCVYSGETALNLLLEVPDEMINAG